MATERDILRSRLKGGNAGSIKQNIYLCAVPRFLSLKTAPVLTPETADDIVADITARDALTPADGDIAYVTSNGFFYKYTAATSSWALIYKGVITDTHTFTSPAGFHKIQFTQNKRKSSIEGPESSDVSGVRITTVGSVAGIDKTLSQLLIEAPFTDFIVLVPDNNGRMIQQGSADNPAIVKLNSAQTGESPLDYNGAEISIVSEDQYITFYEGTITLTTD